MTTREDNTIICSNCRSEVSQEGQTLAREWRRRAEKSEARVVDLHRMLQCVYCCTEPEGPKGSCPCSHAPCVHDGAAAGWRARTP